MIVLFSGYFDVASVLTPVKQVNQIIAMTIDHIRMIHTINFDILKAPVLHGMVAYRPGS